MFLSPLTWLSPQIVSTKPCWCLKLEQKLRNFYTSNTIHDQILLDAVTSQPGSSRQLWLALLRLPYHVHSFLTPWMSLTASTTNMPSCQRCNLLNTQLIFLIACIFFCSFGSCFQSRCFLSRHASSSLALSSFVYLAFRLGETICFFTPTNVPAGNSYLCLGK